MVGNLPILVTIWLRFFPESLSRNSSLGADRIERVKQSGEIHHVSREPRCVSSLFSAFVGGFAPHFR